MFHKILSIFKLNQPKPIQRVEWVHGELVIPDWLKGDGEPVKQHEYVRPAHRCSKWVLLSGRIYGDEHYTGAVLIKTRNLIAWITSHAENTSVSILAQQQAKEYMPTWFAIADTDDESPGKISKSGICHAQGTTYYSKTKKYTAYNTQEECLQTGGRKPKR